MSDATKKTDLLPDSDDAWVEVELYRWQHGELPMNYDESKMLEIPKAVRAMAAAIEKGCELRDSKDMPSPVSVYRVMKYLARLVEKQAEPGGRN